jgi:hypothetical protein
VPPEGRELQDYVSALREAGRVPVQQDPDGRLARWIRWAEVYVSDLDPTQRVESLPHDPAGLVLPSTLRRLSATMATPGTKPCFQWNFLSCGTRGSSDSSSPPGSLTTAVPRPISKPTTLRQEHTWRKPGSQSHGPRRLRDATTNAAKDAQRKLGAPSKYHYRDSTCQIAPRRGPQTPGRPQWSGSTSWSV